ncbi:MAG: hypothetical protein PHC64_08635 [Candidatus Gastranaerophilales bacterium]|nr:hypothetical protein [Candidatus Gastranaerophilales bacterium]
MQVANIQGFQPAQYRKPMQKKTNISFGERSHTEILSPEELAMRQ